MPGITQPHLAVYSLTATLLLLILASISAWLFVKYRKIRSRNLQVEQQLLLSQMNPHFVFNSLTAIQSYIFRNEAHLASKYLASFAKLIRLILENSRAELNSLEREINTLKHYLELQALRFDGRFEYKITVDENIHADSVKIPPMLAQPFIENAIEHGLLHLSEKGILIIRFLMDEEEYLTIEVEDNGIGIEKSKQLQAGTGSNHHSLATQITMERLKKIKRSKGINIELNIADLGRHNAKNHGTMVKFKIPIQQC
ncbi:MAG: sensor histidine kinase [Bacteroidales bacterium]